ncbi:MAG: hypothetical protein ABSD03_11405 [Vulcanimicrobiaceae bacterium]
MRITPPRALVFSAFALAVLVAGCGGGGALDYGTTSINTTACTGFTPALVSPAPGATNVPDATSSIEISVTPNTSALAETPTAYQLILDDNAGNAYTLGALTVATGAPSGYTYLTASISGTNAPQPLAAKDQYYITLYNVSSTCELKDFATFTTT